jgi:hypothetical protein
LFDIRICELLPCIPVPLVGQDPDVLLDLQVAANRVYREGPYARAVDYSGEPDPPLKINTFAQLVGEASLCPPGVVA